MWKNGFLKKTEIILLIKLKNGDIVPLTLFLVPLFSSLEVIAFFLFPFYHLLVTSPSLLLSPIPSKKSPFRVLSSASLFLLIKSLFKVSLAGARALWFEEEKKDSNLIYDECITLIYCYTIVLLCFMKRIVAM